MPICLIARGAIYLSFVEYGMGGKVSTYGDIYSYGILLLEMFTGKRPTDEMFKDGLDLHNFVKTALPERISEVVDPLFVAGGGGKEEEEITNEDIYILADIKKDQLQDSLTEILRIGVACSVESPKERMKLSDVLKELQLVRGLLLGSTVK
ncbi:putative receptor-like protein kinase At3g47110 [Durio zibethinus]|uniref:Receptor-like protein kinase At3g47110 n=1 Tax=Durio zibethinus TaxID=66656 RepID=A0A6P6AMZ2_DURZI|nr:putative receptor-like protein kinase At3g47110 [Durio zibethinus]